MTRARGRILKGEIRKKIRGTARFMCRPGVRPVNVPARIPRRSAKINSISILDSRNSPNF